MARASAEAMPSCSHSAVAPAATAWRAMSEVCPPGTEHIDQAHLLGDAGQRPVGRLAEELVGVRIDRDDPPAVPLHVGGHRVGRLGRGPARPDHGDGVVAGQDALDDGVGTGHLVTITAGEASLGQPGLCQPRQGGGAGDRAEPVRRRAQGLVLVLGEVDAGGRYVALELADARRARDGDDAGPVDDPGQRDLGRSGGVRVRHLAQGRDQFAGPVEVLREEQRIGGPQRVRRPAVPVVPAGEQPLGERAVGDHDVAGRGGERQQVPLRGPVDEAVADLVAQHAAAQRLLGGAPAVQRVVADAYLGDQPDPLQRAHAAHDRPVPDQRVGLVHLVQVETADAEPVRAGHRALLHDGGNREEREELRGQEGRFPAFRQRRAEDPLAAAEPVELRGVEQGDAEFDRAAHDGLRLAPGVGLAVSPLPGAELPAAEPDPRDLRRRSRFEVTHESYVRPCYHLSLAIWS